jgi:hypothetical protein
MGLFFPAGDWFRAFLLTVIIEIPVATYLLRRDEPQPWRTAALVFFANLASHPMVWYVWTQVFLFGTPTFVVAAEAWAVVVEAVFYALAFRGLGSGRAVLISVVANAASFAIGRLVMQLFPEVLR